VAAGIIFFRSDQQENTFFSPELKNIKADLVLYGVRYRRDVRGKAAQWLVKAKLARFYEKKKEVEFEDVNIIFQPDGKNPVTVKAKKGKYMAASGTVAVSGDVKVTGMKDYVLITDILFYYPEKKAIESPGNVRLVGGEGNELVGKNMVYLLTDHKLLLYFPRAIIKEEDLGV